MHNDSGRSNGFLSKVMHMVRGASPVPAGASATDTDSLNNREALQEVVERKRRNDAIRQQEFAQLRQLRQRNVMAGQGAKAAVTQDAVFLPSLIGQDTRSVQTLQKIDEIEAQMSSQWWRHGSESPQAEAKPLPSKLSEQSLSRLPVLGEECVVHSLQTLDASSAAPVAVESQATFSDADAQKAEVVMSEPAKVAAPMPKVFQPHPDLEEAAILFAHGDLQGARTRLLEQLVQSLSAAPVDEEKVSVLWHAVLDLCRATGDEETFEPLAIDYADHFGRSAPLWFSIPARVGIPALAGGATKKQEKRQFQWSSPSMLTVGSVTALRAAFADAPQPWSMSWLRLASIDEAALLPLAKLLEEWASSAVQLVLSDAGKLLGLLEKNTPASDATYAEQWWVLRMALLRLVDRMDDYEQVALDYCITYEVSPPSWVDPLCQCVVQEDGEVDATVLQESLLHSRNDAGVAASPTEALPSLGKGLAGVIEGDAQPWLDAMAVKAKVGQALEISCENLIRLDFVAAGGVLNWAADMQSQGHVLRFTQLHQLVAVFFHVIGINEHASVQASKS